MLRCSDNSIYTGYTIDLKKRLDTHNEGKGAKYTRTRLPVDLLYFEEYSTKSAALKREHAIKKLTKKQKEQMIEK
jgi:putative endonuclease